MALSKPVSDCTTVFYASFKTTNKNLLIWIVAQPVPTAKHSQWFSVSKGTGLMPVHLTNSKNESPSAP